MSGLTVLIEVALRAIARNKMRSTLTMLGIIIGVACVIAMIAIGSGASRAIQDRINSLGSNFIMVFPGTSTSGGAHIWSAQSSLTPDDAAAIKAECPSVAYESPSVHTAAQVIAGETNWVTQIQGVGAEWPFVRSWNTAEGAFFSDAEARSRSKVCVLGATVADNLFPNGGAVGQDVRIKNVPFRVVGVLERKGAMMFGDQDDVVVAPYTTVMEQLTGKANKLNDIYVSALTMNDVPEAQREIEALLRQRHHLAPNQDSDFSMRSQEEFAQTSQESSRTLSLLLASAAAISLLVGGIGIMNIMLVSVTERTREIGIRMAIGAKGKQVLLQFLIEAVTLSVCGGALGTVLGIIASKIVAAKGGLPVLIAPASIVLAFGFSGAIGIFFGFYPARKASRLDPIDALRYE